MPAILAASNLSPVNVVPVKVSAFGTATVAFFEAGAAAGATDAGAPDGGAAGGVDATGAVLQAAAANAVTARADTSPDTRTARCPVISPRSAR
ncbi:hypothetical protein Aut01nite_74280 [Actinoplanes utahensis]|nr:hypothetical protein Aut01nite_74280 [Actinoplanes utahensis]